MKLQDFENLHIGIFNKFNPKDSDAEKLGALDCQTCTPNSQSQAPSDRGILIVIDTYWASESISRFRKTNMKLLKGKQPLR